MGEDSRRGGASVEDALGAARRSDGDSEEQARRARGRLAVGAALVALLLLAASMPFGRALLPAGSSDASAYRGRSAALGWLILLLGTALPYVALALRFADGLPSPWLRGAARFLGWLPVWCVCIALAAGERR